ncbi:methyltransferase domain-containing protein [Nocardioides agariphilus]|jgi:SAM-dependent methyltransferase|uniref:Methyltransferase domain-containing protein n=1 Tax=Nocardioides agariphilus TaxID=433664 RepID=A0A930VMC4_9ACTN|nr:class I SAM-dependent methyltransferase [Nocardioides agariphilus]MBF4769307.1 methyltransferase domain-containing protein [Nocardioides agariphilus]
MSSTAEIELTGAVTERLFASLLGALELATVHLGVRLGLYEALATPRTAAGLAEVAGIDERYAAEWLEQQAISGLVSVTEPGDRETRVYGLDAEQALSFGDPESPAYAGAMALLMGGVGRVIEQLPEIYRTGGGIAFGGYGDDVRLGQGLFNRSGFLGQLTQEWLPAIDGVGDLLGRPGARALDIGCGVGWSSIALASAYPGLTVLGIDSDDASVMDARRNAAEAGLGERVRFEVGDAAAPPAGEGYDVAFYFEALHDLPHPVESLAAVRSALRPGGVTVVVDERAEEEFAPGGSEVERLLATSSVLHCLPVGRSQPGSAGTGALFRPSVMRDYAARAGYAGVEDVPVTHDLFRFFLVRP